MYDVHFFQFAGKNYCYDIPSGTVLNSNQLFQEVLQYFHHSSKLIVKELSKRYPLKDITEAVVRVQELERRKLLETKVSPKLIYDHSNLISFECIYFNELTEEVVNTYKSILERLHLREADVKLNKLEKPSCFIKTAVNTDSSDPFDRIELFLRSWNSSCHLCMSEPEYESVVKAIETAEKQMDLLDEYLSAEDAFERFNEITALIRRIHKKEKKFTHCPAGIEYLVISNTGSIYNCTEHEKACIPKSLDSIGYIASLMDIEECKECFCRFLCGGRCCLFTNSPSACSAMQKIIEFVLGCSISLAEADKELLPGL